MHIDLEISIRLSRPGLVDKFAADPGARSLEARRKDLVLFSYLCEREENKKG